MKKQSVILFNLIAAIIFAVLFYRNHIGINLFIFELIAVPAMLYINRPVKFNGLLYLILGSVILTSIMTVVVNSYWSIFINFIMLFTLSTALSFQGFRSLLHLQIETALRFIISQFSFSYNWDKINNDRLGENANSSPEMDLPPTKAKRHKYSFSSSKFLYLIILPIAITFLFIILYSQGNSIFYLKFKFLIDDIINFIRSINLLFFVYILLGLIIGNHLFMKTKPVGLYQNDLNEPTDLKRKKRPLFLNFKKTGLRLKCQVGIVLLSCLNLLILYFNALDFRYVWFSFKWNGLFLKEFVHNGTWVLVFCIFLSSLIVLYFFKGNLNFYSKNKILKILCKIWIFQNAIMCISVMFRNYWYIYYFGLAYKRIAVLFFLLLCLIGLVSIVLKILNKKTTFYLLKINGISLVIVLTLTTIVNWDVLIAKYNFKHYDRSLIDHEFIANLNDASLPYSFKTSSEIKEINRVQEENLPYITNYADNWATIHYKNAINKNLDSFITRYENKNILEWNLADYITYRRLKERNIIPK